jgi:alkylhydroperoxidase family enzyme
MVSAQILTDRERDMIKSAAKCGTRSGELFMEGKEKEAFGEKEKVLLKFLEEVTSGPTVNDGLWEVMKRSFTEREIVEILSLQVSWFLLLFRAR